MEAQPQLCTCQDPAELSLRPQKDAQMRLNSRACGDGGDSLGLSDTGPFCCFPKSARRFFWRHPKSIRKRVESPSPGICMHTYQRNKQTFTQPRNTHHKTQQDETKHNTTNNKGRTKRKQLSVSQSLMKTSVYMSTCVCMHCVYIYTLIYI